jgi:phosphoglycolate phosphatase
VRCTNLKAVLFDLEDTLVVSGYRWSPGLMVDLRRQAREVLIRNGVPANVLGGVVRYTLLRNLSFRWAEENLDPSESARLRDAVEAMMKPFDEDTAEKAELFPDTLEALSMLTRNGVAMGLVTNTSTAAALRMMDRFDMKGFFPVVVSRNDVPLLKPDPAMLYKAKEMLGIDVGWMVGDSIFDADAARSIGIRSIIVRRDGVKPEFEHDHFISSLEGVYPLISGS